MDKQFRFLIAYNSKNQNSLDFMIRIKFKLFMYLTSERSIKKDRVFFQEGHNMWGIKSTAIEEKDNQEYYDSIRVMNKLAGIGEKQKGYDEILLHWFDISKRNIDRFSNKYFRKTFKIYICDNNENARVYNDLQYLFVSRGYGEYTCKEIQGHFFNDESVIFNSFILDFNGLVRDYDVYEIGSDFKSDFEPFIKIVKIYDIKNFQNDKHFFTKEKAKEYLKEKCLKDIRHYENVVRNLKTRYEKIKQM